MHFTDINLSADLLAKGDILKKRTSTKLSDSTIHTLDRAAKLIHASPESLKNDTEKNILGGAALPSDYQKQITGTRSRDLEDWFGTVAEDSGSVPIMKRVRFCRSSL